MLPIIPALFSIPRCTNYAQNYAGIMYQSLHTTHNSIHYSISCTHLTPPTHPLICQHLQNQWFLFLVLPADLLLQHLSPASLLWCSSLGIYQFVQVALTVILNLRLLHMTCVLGTLSGDLLHWMVRLNPSLPLLTTM